MHNNHIWETLKYITERRIELSTIRFATLSDSPRSAKNQWGLNSNSKSEIGIRIVDQTLLVTYFASSPTIIWRFCRGLGWGRCWWCGSLRSYGGRRCCCGCGIVHGQFAVTIFQLIDQTGLFRGQNNRRQEECKQCNAQKCNQLVIGNPSLKRIQDVD